VERRTALMFELAAMAAAILGAWVIGGIATDAWLARVATLGLPHPGADAVVGLGRRANLYFTVGIAILAAARTVATLRARDPLPAPIVLPAAVLAALLGLIVHHATVDTGTAGVAMPSAAGFAEGFLLGAVAAAIVLLAPLDLAELASRWRIALAVVIGAIFAALAVAGSGPGGSGTRINLGPVQPIEVVKPIVVLFLAGFLGRRAAKLRWQRRRILGLRWPRLGLLVPGLLVLVGIVLGLFVVGDLGPVLLLAAVFLAMFYVVTRATGWVVAAVALLAGLLIVIASWPGLVETGRVATRVRIWKDPWTNGLSHGHQVGEGLWAFAAGGTFGQGLGQASTPLPPAAETDLVLAPVVEQLGVVALLAYLALIGAIALGGLAVAARGRTPERVLIAAGAAVLLLVQWALIHGGTLGALPLTGIVVPFLSLGRSSMIAFLVLVGVIARLALDGPARATTDELVELQGAARSLRVVVIGLVAIGGLLAVRVAVVDRADVSARGIVNRLADGTLVHRQNPRLLAIARAIRRGTIEDRRGEPLAITAPAGVRRYPLGTALGTLLGTDPSDVLRPRWALERALDHRLRGYGERTGGPRYHDFDRRGPDAPLPWPDLRGFVPLLARSPAERAAAVRAVDADVAVRSVRLSIDARLQAAIAKLAAPVVAEHRGAAVAVAVIDVDTGQVLARVQVPDLDPNDRSWQERVLAGELAYNRRFQGAYGAWPDKTGVQGMFQAGSVAKLFTALAAVRAGIPSHGSGCRARADVRFACTERDEQGPFFTRPGWPKPIHDHTGDPVHGELELAGALAVSCNVYFGQLGLAIGAAPFADLRDAGTDIGYPGGAFVPGEAGSRQLASTAFGQGAMVLNVMQAARLVAAIAGGGRYRRCPPTMELDATCAETPLVPEAEALAPIVAGMRLVMTDGTGRRLSPPAGVRVYGKTGTADVRGFVGEEPFGIAPAQVAPPHSWFVGFAEPDRVAECSAVAPGRLAIAVVVPRGGTGAATAGPLAMKVLDAARELGYLGGTP